MGYSRWSDDTYSSRVSLRASTHTPTFEYHEKVTSGKASGCHDSLNPLGKNRESRDSDGNPNSRAVAVLLDVTGSMRNVPRTVQEKLPTLMGLLQRRSYLSDPHILVGAIGDETSHDRVPLQIGQFEAGIEIDDDITNLYLEGGGGSGLAESYELGMYFMARHTSIDCYEKRGDKGYLFIIGDEPAYTEVSATQVKKLIGDDGLQSNIPIQDIAAELQEKYEVFFIIPKLTTHYGQKRLEDFWENLFPQRVLKLEDPNGICELIATTIAVNEGFEVADVADCMTEMGTAMTTVNAVKNSVAKLSPRSKSISVTTSNEPIGLE